MLGHVREIIETFKCSVVVTYFLIFEKDYSFASNRKSLFLLAIPDFYSRVCVGGGGGQAWGNIYL